MGRCKSVYKLFGRKQRQELQLMGMVIIDCKIELAFVIQDCREAGEAMRGWNPEKENYYADQRMTYSDEMRRRQKRDPFAFAKFFKDGVFVGKINA